MTAKTYFAHDTLCSLAELIELRVTRLTCIPMVADRKPSVTNPSAESHAGLSRKLVHKLDVHNRSRQDSHSDTRVSRVVLRDSSGSRQ
jgi:hypothetical protein